MCLLFSILVSVIWNWAQYCKCLLYTSRQVHERDKSYCCAASMRAGKDARMPRPSKYSPAKIIRPSNRLRKVQVINVYSLQFLQGFCLFLFTLVYCTISRYNIPDRPTKRPASIPKNDAAQSLNVLTIEPASRNSVDLLWKIYLPEQWVANRIKFIV